MIEHVLGSGFACLCNAKYHNKEPPLNADELGSVEDIENAIWHYCQLKGIAIQSAAFKATAAISSAASSA
jgi:hypothetical protein